MAMKFNGNGTIEGLSLGGLGDSGAVDSGSIADPLEVHLKSGRKNLIINGNFDVWQRGTNFVSDEYTADRWKFERSDGAGSVARGTFDAGQTDVPGSKYYLSMDCSTGNNNFGIHYAHEYVESIQNRKVTVSFYAKHNQGNANPVNLPSEGIKVRLGLVAVDGTTDTIQTLTPTDTWVKYSFTFGAPTTDGATIDANSYHQLSIFQDSADTGTGSWDINLAQVQMEIGEVATDFEQRSYGEELALCQRYFIKSSGLLFETNNLFPCHKVNASGSGAIAVANYDVFRITGLSVMRTTPTLIHSNFAEITIHLEHGGVLATATAVPTVSRSGVVTVAHNLTDTTDATQIRFKQPIQLDAEL